MPDAVTIDQALDAFLREQRARLSDRTYRNYEDVIGLLRDSLNRYAYSSLDARDSKRWQKAFDAGNEEAFCKLFGPEEIPPHLGEFLGYFMVRKVIAGQELDGVHRRGTPQAGRLDACVKPEHDERFRRIADDYLDRPGGSRPATAQGQHAPAS